MAAGDDRSILQVVADDKGATKLLYLNEVLRQVQESVNALEGRLGEITLRDSLRLMGKETWVGQATQTGESGSGVIYYDTLLAKLRASENGGAMVNLIPNGIRVRFSSPTGVGNGCGVI